METAKYDQACIFARNYQMAKVWQASRLFRSLLAFFIRSLVILVTPQKMTMTQDGKVAITNVAQAGQDPGRLKVLRGPAVTCCTRHERRACPGKYCG